MKVWIEKIFSRVHTSFCRLHMEEISISLHLRKFVPRGYYRMRTHLAVGFTVLSFVNIHKVTIFFITISCLVALVYGVLSEKLMSSVDPLSWTYVLGFVFAGLPSTRCILLQRTRRSIRTIQQSSLVLPCRIYCCLSLGLSIVEYAWSE